MITAPHSGKCTITLSVANTPISEKTTTIHHPDDVEVSDRVFVAAVVIAWSVMVPAPSAESEPQ
jgi:hypothetical protein